MLFSISPQQSHHRAAQPSLTEDVTVFLTNRASFVALDEKSLAPLCIASKHSHVSVMDDGLNAAADIDAVKKDGNTALC